jgi:DNA repair exonuclease SbcCD ATPase subunit
MNKQYVSIKEAIDITGMSDASIRRLCRKGLKGRDYKYDVEGKLYVNDLFLYTSYPPQNKATQMLMNVDYERLKSLEEEVVQFKEAVKQHPLELLHEKDKRIEDLKDEIESKNATIMNLSLAIEGLNNNIGMLSERTREQNIIIQSLQEKVSHQLKPSSQVQVQPTKKEKAVSLVDKLLIGVAILASVAIISFIGAMLFAYFSNS